jgi:hypothetical protein
MDQVKRRSVLSMIAGALGFGAAAKAATDKLSVTATPSNANTKLPDGVLEELDRLRTSLTGCSVAAMTGTSAETDYTPDQLAWHPAWTWHPAYQDVLDLRRKLESALRVIRERSPKGNVDVFYPCGCSSTGPVITEDGGGSPFYCGEHDPEAKLSTQCSVAFGEKVSQDTVRH